MRHRARIDDRPCDPFGGSRALIVGESALVPARRRRSERSARVTLVPSVGPFEAAPSGSGSLRGKESKMREPLVVLRSSLQPAGASCPSPRGQDDNDEAAVEEVESAGNAFHEDAEDVPDAGTAARICRRRS
jgi:hypothetical protein